MPDSQTRPRLRTAELTYIALMAVIIALCAWISIPAVVPFTLQTCGVFCALGLLGGRRGGYAVLLYLLLGAIGLPVFAGFHGGVGALVGPTGGYLLGFVLSALAYWAVTARLGEKLFAQALAMVLGLILCYAFGTAWYMVSYTQSTAPISLATALGWCVTPFILPDLMKISLALVLVHRLKRHVKL